MSSVGNSARLIAGLLLVGLVLTSCASAEPQETPKGAASREASERVADEAFLCETWASVYVDQADRILGLIDRGISRRDYSFEIELQGGIGGGPEVDTLSELDCSTVEQPLQDLQDTLYEAARHWEQRYRLWALATDDLVEAKAAIKTLLDS